MDNSLGPRPSPIAGRWYPENAEILAKQVDNYINSAVLPELNGEVVGVMAPHAGHRYSGPVAGFAFAALLGLKPDVVVVVSPMHQPYYEPLITTAHDAYTTPLGKIPVDHDALNLLDNYLQQELGIGLKRVVQDNEHSLEIELPFLQRSLDKPFRLVPVMVRDQSIRVAQSLGDALSKLITSEEGLGSQKTILVASTDLSHFYPQSVANKLDSRVLSQVEAFDPEGLIQVEERGDGFACGRGALAAVLWASKTMGADSVQILNYATSGDVTGDYSQVVGYGAAAIIRKNH